MCFCDALAAVDRRDFIKAGSLSLLGANFWGMSGGNAIADVPDEPIEIGTQTQFFFDDGLVDNRYALSGKRNDIPLRKFHTPVKHERNPVLLDPGVAPVFFTVRHDREANLFRAWYQAAVPLVVGQATKGRLMGYYHLRYAESRDGIEWTRPNLGLYEFQGNKNNNICFAHPQFEEHVATKKMSATRGTSAISSMSFLNEADMPEADRRGYKYLMTYMLRGGGPRPEDRTQCFLIGSRDGVHWDRDGQMSLFVGGSDGWFGASYDAVRKKYVAFVRPRDRYEGGPSRKPMDAESPADDAAYEGVVRRIARLESDTLWTPWEFWPRTVFLPDAQDRDYDVTSHMAIGVTIHAGHYFGFLIPYVPKESLWAELLLSRDGKNFERTHHRVLSTGADDAWDRKQAWISPQWVEVGDEWRLYYFGATSGPNTPLQADTTWGIGMVSIRKEGFVSINGSSRGGVIVTRLLKWPGGNLVVNANAAEGEFRVRVSSKHRETIPGFDYSDGLPVTGDKVAHKIAWKTRSLDELKGQELRLEFHLPRNADLFAFRAE